MTFILHVSLHLQCDIYSFCLSGCKNIFHTKELNLSYAMVFYNGITKSQCPTLSKKKSHSVLISWKNKE